MKDIKIIYQIVKQKENAIKEAIRLAEEKGYRDLNEII